MSNCRDLLFNEYGDMKVKIQKYEAVVLSKSFETISDVDKRDIREQIRHMKDYFKILKRRVSRQCNSA